MALGEKLLSWYSVRIWVAFMTEEEQHCRCVDMWSCQTVGTGHVRESRYQSVESVGICLVCESRISGPNNQ